MIQTLDYISKDIEPLNLNDKIEKAKEIFEELSISHFPVVDRDMYQGTLVKKDFEFLNSNNLLENHKNLLQPIYANDRMSWFEVLQCFANYNSKFLPVLNSKMKYLGYYELDDFLNIFKCTPFLHEEGVTLTISKGINDYSFSEVSQIVEANNATLFGIFVSKIENETTEITIKLSPHDINNTMLSFRRYGYLILSKTHEDKYLDNLKERSDYLEKYLNI